MSDSQRSNFCSFSRQTCVVGGTGWRRAEGAAWERGGNPSEAAEPRPRERNETYRAAPSGGRITDLRELLPGQQSVRMRVCHRFLSLIRVFLPGFLVRQAPKGQHGPPQPVPLDVQTHNLLQRSVHEISRSRPIGCVLPLLLQEVGEDEKERVHGGCQVQVTIALDPVPDKPG